MAGNFKVFDLSSLRKALIFSSILHLNFSFSAFCLSPSLASYSWRKLFSWAAIFLNNLLFLLHHFLFFWGWGRLWLVHGSHDAEVLKLAWASIKERVYYLPRRSIMTCFPSSPSSSKVSHSHSPEKIAFWDESATKIFDTENRHETTEETARNGD